MSKVSELEEVLAMEELTLGKKLDISWKFLKKSINPQYPMALLLAVTEACPLKCSFCNFRAGKRRPDELTVEEIESLYKQGRELGMFYTHIWGGEPTVHPDLGAIVRLAKENDYVVGMISSGWWVAERINEVAPYIDRYYFSVDA